MKKIFSLFLAFLLVFIFMIPISAETDSEDEVLYEQMKNIIGEERIVASLKFKDLDSKTYEYIKNIEERIDPDSIGMISYIKTEDENVLDINVVALLDDNTYVSITAQQLSEREDGSLFHSTNGELFSSFNENLRANPLYGFTYPASTTLYAYIYFDKHSYYTALIRPKRGKFYFTYNSSTPNFYVRNFAMTYYAKGEVWTVIGNNASTNHTYKTWQVSQSQANASPSTEYYSGYNYLIANQYLEISVTADCGAGCNYSFEKVLNSNGSSSVYQGYIDLGQNVS